MKPIIDKYIILAKSVAVAFVVAFVACLTAVAQERTDTVSYRYIPLSQEEIDSLEEASALKDIAHMPARVKCAVLGWRTLKEAIQEN